MKVYISGPISGYNDEKTQALFAQAAAQVRSLGHEPVSPLSNGLHASAPWEMHMVADIKLLFDCLGIYLLKGWEKSKGSRIEAVIAKEHGLEIIYQPEVSTLPGINKF